MIKEVLKAFIKTIIVLTPFTVVSIVICLISQTNEKANINEYYRSAEVFRVENEVVYLEDTQGYVWCVKDDTLKMFGRYILVMDSCGTEDITDDIILEIK